MNRRGFFGLGAAAVAVPLPATLGRLQFNDSGDFGAGPDIRKSFQGDGGAQGLSVVFSKTAGTGGPRVFHLSNADAGYAIGATITFYNFSSERWLIASPAGSLSLGAGDSAAMTKLSATEWVMRA